MVEVEIDQQFVTQIVFEDELGLEVKVAVEYDWLPITCQKCKDIGHKTSNCRRKEIGGRRPIGAPPKQVWRPKVVGASTVDPVEFPPLARASIPIQPDNGNGNAAAAIATPIVTPAPSQGPIYTPAKVITKMTRHETRVVDGRQGAFNVNFNAEMAVASDSTELKHLKWFLHQNDVELFGLLETRVKPSSLNNVASNVCYGWNYVTNTSEHPGGRIWVLWKGNSVVVDVLEMSEQYIHTRVRMVHNGTVFLATFIYAFNKIEHRVPLWTALDRLSGNGPWIVLGDFNNVLYANERLGKAVSDEEMLPFQSIVASCDLHDMKTTGAFFTWNNKQTK
ncbi:uncharacterized protein LOC141651429 [Silene latifolia]|uniref:uncharacterized protein LOC141651429 n=1 Tax=Silene latifolia TaxID=37657 RepID=UPI003D782132